VAVSDSVSGRSPRALLVVLALVSFMNYTDRWVLPAVGQSLKEEFALSDTQLGFLNGLAFVLVYGFASLPLARFADRTSRTKVLAAALAFWSLATAACGIVKSFGQLVVARACVGIGESACQPVGYAIVSENVPADKRNTGIALFLLGNNLGIATGFALGGWIGAQYGWRMAFILIGLPGLLLAAALWMLRVPNAVTLPPRQAGPSEFAVVWQLFRSNRTYRNLVLLGAVYSMTIFGPSAFLVPFFIRSHGFARAQVGLLAGFALGIGMAIGGLLGGILGDRLKARGPQRAQWLCAASILLSGLIFVFVFLTANPWAAFGAAFVAFVVGTIASPIIAAAVQDESPPQLRALAASIATLVISVIGIASAPLIVGWLSDLLQPAYGNESLRYALLICLVFCALTAWMHYQVGRSQQASRVQLLGHRPPA
jgi:predicted MFS family arabinose efflux permease